MATASQPSSLDTAWGLSARLDPREGLGERGGPFGGGLGVLVVGGCSEVVQLTLDVADRSIVEGGAMRSQTHSVGDIAGDVAGIRLLAPGVDQELARPDLEPRHVDLDRRPVLELEVEARHATLDEASRAPSALWASPRA